MLYLIPGLCCRSPLVWVTLSREVSSKGSQWDAVRVTILVSAAVHAASLLHYLVERMVCTMFTLDRCQLQWAVLKTPPQENRDQWRALDFIYHDTEAGSLLSFSILFPATLSFAGYGPATLKYLSFPTHNTYFCLHRLMLFSLLRMSRTPPLPSPSFSRIQFFTRHPTISQVSIKHYLCVRYYVRCWRSRGGYRKAPPFQSSQGEHGADRQVNERRQRRN